MKLTTALRNTIVSNIITAAGTNPKLKYYTGTESLTPAGTLLATLTVTGALGTATSGVIDFNETVTQTNASHVAGTPTFILVTTTPVATVPVKVASRPRLMRLSARWLSVRMRPLPARLQPASIFRSRLAQRSRLATPKTWLLRSAIRML